MKEIDLKKSKYAYMFGFIQGDGSLYEYSRNRGKLRIELSKKDEFILKQFSKLIPYNNTISYRTRDTNFSKNYTSVILSIQDIEFRKEIKALGMVSGKKSKIIKPPTISFSEKDYYRGLIDADGSLGITANKIPFISFTTDSEFIANKFMKFIKTITNKDKTCNRNKRDNIFNIIYWKEDAVKIVKFLYYKNCLALPRKIKSSKKVLKWKRPKYMKNRNY